MARGGTVSMRPEELPPKPDAESGVPWPDPGPVPSYWYRTRPKQWYRERRARAQVSVSEDVRPPSGQQRAFAISRPSGWARANWSVTLSITGFLALMLGGGAFLVGWFGSWPPPWWFWVVCVLALFSVRARHVEYRLGWCAAGVEWLDVPGENWVRLYDLAEVVTGRVGGESGVKLRLTDTDGRTVRVDFETLYAEPRVWDLVFNGILHSVVKRGAGTDARLHRVLSLPRRADSTADLAVDSDTGIGVVDNGPVRIPFTAGAWWIPWGAVLSLFILLTSGDLSDPLEYPLRIAVGVTVGVFFWLCAQAFHRATKGRFLDRT